MKFGTAGGVPEILIRYLPESLEVGGRMTHIGDDAMRFGVKTRPIAK